MGLCGIGPVGFFDLDADAGGHQHREPHHHRQRDLEHPAQRGRRRREQRRVRLRSDLRPRRRQPGRARQHHHRLRGRHRPRRSAASSSCTPRWPRSAATRCCRPAPGRRAAETQAAAGLRAGIMLLAVTPPALSRRSTLYGYPCRRAAFAAPVYQPGLPAVRVEHNVVQVAVGEALEIMGLGPFSVVNNSLSSGGTISLRRHRARRDRHDPEPRRRRWMSTKRHSFPGVPELPRPRIRRCLAGRGRRRRPAGPSSSRITSVSSRRAPDTSLASPPCSSAASITCCSATTSAGRTG